MMEAMALGMVAVLFFLAGYGWAGLRRHGLPPSELDEC